jgi:hypothetical protein
MRRISDFLREVGPLRKWLDANVPDTGGP